MPFEALAKKGYRPHLQCPRIGMRRIGKQDASRGFSGAGRLMRYVYLIESIADPDEHYVGMTDDLRSRLIAHNAGQSRHTSKFKPWRLVTYLGFTDPSKALAFERYLKSGSGHAFARKRLW